MRKRSGSVIKRRGSWWARVTFINPMTGKRSDIQRAAKTKAAAGDLRDKLLRDFDSTDGWALVHERKTFEDLVGFYGEKYVREPVYVDGRKVAGLRSFGTVRGQLEVLKKYFGARPLRSISYEDLRTFKADRLQALPVWVEKALAKAREKREKAAAAGDQESMKKLDAEIEGLSGKQRRIASVHRELALLSKMLGVAERERWILANPFKHGDALISPADEEKRQTILSRDDELRLLAACAKPSRKHLSAIVITALDTGMRQGEILKLRWSDLDFDRGLIAVRAFNTKTLSSRQVAMTPRVAKALAALRDARSEASDDASVFGIKDNVKRAFCAARAEAGLPGLRFHDLRHTAASRLASASLSLGEIGRVLGHTQPRTTYRYVNENEATANRAAAALAQYGVAEPVSPQASA